MTPSGPARRPTVIVGEDDVWRHRPVYSEIVHRAHQAERAGASVLRGSEGFGASRLVRDAARQAVR